MDGKSLHAVVVREAGPTETWWGACPKTYSFTNERWVYLLSYELDSQHSERPAVPRVSLLLHTKKGRRTWRAATWDEQRFPASREASQDTAGRRGLTPLENGIDPQDGLELESLGFDTRRAKYRAEADGVRWYLGFEVREQDIQVCSPTTGFSAKTRLDPNVVDYGAIWDHEHWRVVFPEDGVRAHIVGLPRAVTVWDYRAGKTTSYRLAEISQRTLRHAPAPG